MTNVLKAIKSITANPISEIKEFYSSRTRANSIGDALENYIKDLFSDSFDLSNTEREIKFSEVFSYLGNQNNPPDIILKNGDAIEVKKVQSPFSALALNSSYPKTKLYSESPMITKACKECESWTEKDLLYIVGHTDDKKIKYMWFVYGDCFVADKEIYQRIKETISSGINSIPDVDFTTTNELGKVKKVDPLGVTDLRIRGMWHIENPHRIFSYLRIPNDKQAFQVFCIMKKEKFEPFPEEDINGLLNIKDPNFSLYQIGVKNPNNPAKLMDCVLIRYKN